MGMSFWVRLLRGQCLPDLSERKEKEPSSRALCISVTVVKFYKCVDRSQRFNYALSRGYCFVTVGIVRGDVF